MNNDDLNEMRRKMGEATSAKYVPRSPGDLLQLEVPDDADSFMACIVDNDAPSGDRLRVKRTRSFEGKQALVIQHLSWDVVYAYDRWAEKFHDWHSGEPCDPWCSDPHLEWYFVLCDGRLLYAAREHPSAPDPAVVAIVETELAELRREIGRGE